MKRIALFVTVLLMAAGALAQENEPKQIELTKEEAQLVRSNNDFAFRLFREARTDESQLLSPLSITYALGMLNNAAVGKTQQEINTVLGFGDAGAEAINRFCLKLLTEAAGLDKETRVAIANNIYVNSARGYLLKSAFKEQAKTYYNAEPETRDFFDGLTRDVINQWGSDHTEGMIKETLKEDEFDRMTICYLLNALYFKGVWTQQFNPANTQRTYFNNGKATADMMQIMDGEFQYAQNELYQSVIMPYGNGAYQMTVFLPRYGKTLDDVVAKLNGENWMSAGYRDYNLFLGFPRFETETDVDLKPIMMALGMPSAFIQSEAQFPNLCYWGDSEDNVKDDIFIDLMKQVAKIKVNEEGSEAAAVTVIGLTESAAAGYAEFIADRPFLYVISERSTGAIFFIGQYMGEPLTNVHHDVSLTAEEKELVKSNNDFAINLMREARTEDSQILSPLSITYALGMLNNGAAGKTQQEINKVLGFGEAGADAINQFCRKMLTEAPTLDAETTAEIANTIFVNNHWNYELQQPFVEQAQQYYDATPEARDFYDDATRDVINQWGSDHTHGMIKEVLSEQEFELGKDYVSYLMNALYFKGKWAHPFKKENTREESFNGGIKVPMMSQHGEYEYTENDLYQAIKLPYGNGAYLMTVFLPRQGKTIGNVLEQMDGKNWQFSGGDWEVALKLPRIETNTNVDLKPIMSALGMPTAFNPDGAEFPDFCNYPTYIGLMKQVAKIKLDEEGTEAAAITIIGMAWTGMPRTAEFYATRPFLYIISERSTGTIFFIGQYTGDGTTGVAEIESKRSAGNENYYNLNGQRLQGPPARGLYIKDGRKVMRQQTPFRR